MVLVPTVCSYAHRWEVSMDTPVTVPILEGTVGQPHIHSPSGSFYGRGDTVSKKLSSDSYFLPNVRQIPFVMATKET